MEFNEFIHSILEALDKGEKDITANSLQIKEGFLRETCEWLEDKDLIEGVDYQYYSVDFSDATITSKGKEYLKEQKTF